jgi:hypothetical protein
MGDAVLSDQVPRHGWREDTDRPCVREPISALALPARADGCGSRIVTDFRRSRACRRTPPRAASD